MAGTKRKADTDSKKKKTRKTKKTKDPDAPKRNKSAYMFFCEAKRADVKKANPDLKMTDISKKLAEQWRELTKDDKKVSLSFLKLELINFHRLTKNKLKLTRRDTRKKRRTTKTSKERSPRKMKTRRMMTKPLCSSTNISHAKYERDVFRAVLA